MPPAGADGGKEESMNREQTTIRLPAELLEALREEADRRGYSLKDLILFLLWETVQREEDHSSLPS